VFRKEWGFDSLHGHQPSLLRSYGWQASLAQSGTLIPADKNKPWRLITYVAFSDMRRAI
jgi:hypothetical protein